MRHREDAFRAYTRHCNPALGRFLELTGRDTRFVRASGATLFDDEGNAWDDFIAGFGSLNLGHNPPAILDAISLHLATGAPNLYAEALNPAAGSLARRLIELTSGAFETAFFSNSGTEAVEAAIKAALLATGRAKIAYASGGFHGSTLGALSCMARGLYRDPFDPVLAPFVEVEFGDETALASVVARGDIAAFVLEPFQIEAGARLVTPDYLSRVISLCHDKGVLVVLDEVQTGIGRTGSLFAYQTLGSTPDILVIAKSLGGGVVPIGATLMGPGIWRAAYGSYLRSEIHNSTFGGNALACHAAEATLDLITPDFLAESRATADYLFRGLDRAIGGSSWVRSIRRLGMIGGVALRDIEHPWLTWDGMGLPELAGNPSVGPLVLDRLWKAKILAQVCGHDWSVVRVEPPLVVTQPACDRFVEQIARALYWLEENT